MKKICLTLLVVLAASMATAQLRHPWSAGPLTWNDFNSIVSPDGTNSYQFIEFGFHQVETADADGIRCSYYVADAWMVPLKSWVDANQRTDVHLRYNQIIFNLMELERRQMTKALNNGASPDAAAATALHNLDANILSLSAATADGTDSSAIASWEYVVSKRLNTSVDPDQAPTYELLPVSAGLFIGGTYLMPMKDLKDWFSDGGGMSMGLEVGWNRHIFTTELAVIGTHLQGPISFLYDDGSSHDVNAGAPVTYSNSTVSYGFRLLDTPRQSLTPLIGWSWSSRLVTATDLSEADLYAYGFAFGLNYRFHFSRRYRPMGRSLLLLGTSAELTRWSLDARILMAYNHFPNSMSSVDGWSIQFSLNLALSGRQVQVVPAD